MEQKKFTEISSVTESFLKGFGQIMLQESAVTGFLFLTGIFSGSLYMGIAAILAVVSGMLTARILKFPQEEINAGLYGFSPALVGVALLLFFKPDLWAWIMVILGGALAAVLQNIGIRKKIPLFTLPFVLVTWAILVAPQAGFPLVLAEDGGIMQVSDFNFAFRGYGQVIFQGGLLAGILFFIGVFVHSPVAALYGLAGSITGGVFAAWYGMPDSAVAGGLFGFNAVLCAIVFAGSKREDGFWAFLSVMISLMLSLWFTKQQLPQLTFPFVASAMLTLGIRKVFLSSRKQAS